MTTGITQVAGITATPTGIGSVTSVNGSTGAVTVPTAGRLIGFQVLSGSGTYTPTAGAAAIYVVAVGSGGGSAGHAASTTNAIATHKTSGGGGAGAWCSKYITSLAASYAYACGAAGAAGAAGDNNGGDGAATTFGSTILTAPGGKGAPTQATAAAGQVGGLGGDLATGGDINAVGQSGQIYNPVSISATTRPLVQGGSTPWGTGGRGGATSAGVGTAAANVAGEAGSGLGAGGGPSFSDDGANAIAGAAGAPGGILVWEYS